MKHTLKVLSLILALVLCLGVMAGCSNESDNKQTEPSKESTAPTETLPPNPNKDTIGLVNFSGSYCIGLNLYYTTEVITDYTALDVSTLTSAKDHTTVELGDNVTYKIVKDGALVDTTAVVVREGCMIAVIKNEDKSQTVIILSLPQDEK